MRHFKTLLAVLGAATILVLAANTVVLAATGQSLVLGKANTANTATSLQRTTGGAALKLVTETSSSPPLSTNGNGKVTNLNADEVDGYNSTDMRNRTYVFTSEFTNKSSVGYNLPISNGSYLITVTTWFSGIGATGVECYVADDSFGFITGWSALEHANATGWKPALSASGYATKTASTDVWVVCDTNGGTWSTSVGKPLTITATSTNIIKKTALAPGIVPARIKARR